MSEKPRDPIIRTVPQPADMNGNGDIFGGCGRSQARIVYQNIDAAEFAEAFCNRVFDLRVIGDVELDRENPPACGAHHLGRAAVLLQIAQTEDDVCAGGGEREGATPTDAAGSARHQSDFIMNIEFRCFRRRGQERSVGNGGRHARICSTRFARGQGKVRNKFATHESG